MCPLSTGSKMNPRVKLLAAEPEQRVWGRTVMGDPQWVEAGLSLCSLILLHTLAPVLRMTAASSG